MKWIILFLVLLVLFSGCDEPAPAENETEPYYGDIVLFNYTSLSVSSDGEITVESANTTKEIFIYTYCDIPFGILAQKENYWTWVYPSDKECGEPDNSTFADGIGLSLSEFKFQNGSGLNPGKYLFKIYYSTFGPDEYMRESNAEIEII